MTLRKILWILFRPSDARMVKRLAKSETQSYNQAVDYIRTHEGTEIISDGESISLTPDYFMLITIKCFMKFNVPPDEYQKNKNLTWDGWAEIAYDL